MTAWDTSHYTKEKLYVGGGRPSIYKHNLFEHRFADGLLGLEWDKVLFRGGGGMLWYAGYEPPKKSDRKQAYKKTRAPRNGWRTLTSASYLYIRGVSQRDARARPPVLPARPHPSRRAISPGCPAPLPVTPPTTHDQRKRAPNAKWHPSTARGKSNQTPSCASASHHPPDRRPLARAE